MDGPKAKARARIRGNKDGACQELMMDNSNNNNSSREDGRCPRVRRLEKEVRRVAASHLAAVLPKGLLSRRH